MAETPRQYWTFGRISDERKPVILEVATLNVRPGRERKFESAFTDAPRLNRDMQGYVSDELQRCVETPNRYLLLVNWLSLEHHTIGLGQRAPYLQWKSLPHHFYDPFPVVQHYQRATLD